MKNKKNQSVTEWGRCVKCGVMDTNVEFCVATKLKPCNTLNYWYDANADTQRI